MDYPYRRLDHEKSQIRLLSVSPKPTSITDPLKCSISHVSLDDQPTPTYETISYCWGDPTPVATMVIDDVCVLVPVNTELALRRMASPNHKRILWIDAICINQKDLTERTQQVRLMSRVYSSGKQNLIYLGEEDEWDEKLFDFFKHVHKCLLLSLGLEGQMSDEHMIRILDEPYNLDVAGSCLEGGAVEQFLLHPWFNRLWIVQEAVLSSRNLCIKGRQELNLFVILEAMFWTRFALRTKFSKGLYDALESVAYLWLAGYDYRNSQARVFDLLVLGRSRDCSDQRDKIFGMLGLLSGRDAKIPPALDPDYTKTPRDVFRDATRYMLAGNSCALDPLKHINPHDSEELYHQNWPSWVPRFYRPWSREYDCQVFEHTHNWGNHRSGCLDLDLMYSGTDMDVLVMRGVVIDVIGKAFKLAWKSKPDLQRVQDLEELSSIPGIDVNRFPRLLVADTDWKHQRSSKADRDGYFSMLKCWRKGFSPPEARLIPSDSNEEDIKASRYMTAMDSALVGRCIALTTDSQLVIAPELSQPADLVVKLFGSSYHVVLRPYGEDFLLLGHCYVDGAMPWQNEAGDDPLKWVHDVPSRIFNIR